jgi:hypothetical protein
VYLLQEKAMEVSLVSQKDPVLPSAATMQAIIFVVYLQAGHSNNRKAMCSCLKMHRCLQATQAAATTLVAVFAAVAALKAAI